MGDLTEKIRLKEKADEDLYFARRDREMIAARRAQRAWRLEALRSGGQTGVDRGALDAALELANTGLAVRGWCPRGRRAEDGEIPARYPLTETPQADPAQRTEWNVRDAEATLILARGRLSGGTALTAAVAERLGRPLLIVDPASPDAAPHILAWLRRHRIRDLNVAGPRASEAPDIAEEVKTVLRDLLPAAAAPG